MNSISKAKKILKKLNDCGYEAYIIGGYVRDFLLNIESYDIDITTNALPKEIELIFNVVKSGIDYNSVTIIDGNDSFEITTFRKDVMYNNHRHPVIELVKDLDSDLFRRDYTINALAMDYNNNIVDKFNGISDLNNHIIRTINNPLIRFEEDALRILRGFYLVSKLEFDFDETTFNAIKDKSYLLSELSTFRIISEMKKIIIHNKTNKVFKLMIESNSHKYLKSLDKAIEYVVNNNEIIRSRTLFFSLAFYLNGSYDESYEFNKAKKRKIKEIIKLTMNNITKYDMINFEYDTLMYANDLKMILKLDYIDNFKDYYEGLKIHSVKEINISSMELALALNKMPGEWINFCLIDIANAIIDGVINNDKDSIIEFARKEV